jgi:hypothetical protein
VGAVGALLASQARSPHSNPGGGKLTIGEVGLSRLVPSRAGVASKTPDIPGFSARGCAAAMASAHDVEIPPGAGVFGKTTDFPTQKERQIAREGDKDLALPFLEVPDTYLRSTNWLEECREKTTRMAHFSEGCPLNRRADMRRGQYGYTALHAHGIVMNDPSKG